MLVKTDDLKPSVTRRLLEEAISEIEELKKPRHQRGDKGRPPKEKSAADEDADEENDKAQELAEERGKPRDVDLDDEDLPERAMDKFREQGLKPVRHIKGEKKNKKKNGSKKS